MSRKALVLTAPLAIFYAVESLLVKILLVQDLSTPGTVGMAFRAWVPDLLFVLPVCAVISILASRHGRAVRTASLLLYYTWMAFALLVTAGNYAYFSATGTSLSWSVLEYWARNFQSANQVVASEATTGRILWVIAQPLILALLLIDQKTGVGRRYLLRHQKECVKKAGPLLALGLLLTAGLGLVHVTWERTSPWTRCLAVDWIIDLFSGNNIPFSAAVIPENERFADTWEIVRDPEAPRPNVVLFIFESLGWKATDIYRPGLGATPYLAALAKESMVVRHAYTVVPHTTKALVSILGGYYPYLDMEPKEATPGLLPRKSLAWILKDQGYPTAFFQTASNFERRNNLIANFGFDVFKGLYDMPREGFDKVNYFGREEKMMLEPSLAWVDSQKDRPFFLTYLTLSPHHYYATPSSFPQKDYGVQNKTLNNYLNAVRYTDDFLGQVMDGFRKHGLLEKTLFVILGDHGEAFGEHGGQQHDLILWEEGLRVPIVLHGPGLLPRGEVIEGPRSILDIVPTVCDILGLRLTAGHFLGQSLLEPVSETRRLYFSGCVRQQCLAVREGPVKTIYHFGRRPMEVFDNSGDPLDTENLAGREPYDEEYLASRQAELLAWAAMVQAQYREWEKALKTTKK